ncbi:uncharacterized protein TNIN_428571 [Trichonephila inaurata madagascariensis]|uniref:Uncharacterized protein n=1 Tax=Trichonephila inaurata madagascariensis TaxID=2747483 RepID=A0A8X7CC76_9ARAC|nr:uncharacterized protein TNIN_428571 [Trichonephila inaurata madagascariensis]
MSDIEFHEGIPSDVENITNALIIIDDLMNEVGDDKKLSNLFTKGSHHRDISVIFILQNIFCKGKQIRNISLNTSYLCCFKNVRDKQQISCLARQMYPSQSKFLLESYDDATKAPYGYLFMDLKPETNERLCIQINEGMQEPQREFENSNAEDLKSDISNEDSKEALGFIKFVITYDPAYEAEDSCYG